MHLYAAHAIVLWNLQIFMKYRSGWTVSRLSSFTFEDENLKGKLRKDSGNGWQGGIIESSKVSIHQVMICKVSDCSLFVSPQSMQTPACMLTLVYMHTPCVASPVSQVYS